MKVLFAASEVSPISQIGGLGDVVKSLPLELSKLGVISRIVVPFTTKIDLDYYKCEKMKKYSFSMDGREEEVVVWKTDYLKKVPVYILENKRFFHSQSMHGDFRGYTGLARYVFFSKAVIQLILNWDFFPDIIHAHDYFTSIIALYRNTLYEKIAKIRKIGILLTIHSTRKRQGMAHHSILDFAGIAKEKFSSFPKNRHGEISLLSYGILNADITNTVSPTYAKELLTPQFGHGIEKVLKVRKKDFYGIINGIDIKEYDPFRKDRNYYPYSVKNVFEIKAKNKQKLIEFLNLPQERRDWPLISMVTRLDVQKGIDLVLEVVSELISLGFTFVLLGEGRIDYINKFGKLSRKYKGMVSATFRYDNKLGRLIFAGSDFFLMPSKFEPCGLSEMIAMRFGTLPIVRFVGGLKNVVRDGENGFGFVKYNSRALLSTIKKALKIYNNYHKVKKSSSKKKETKWERMVKAAMRTNVSWERSARQYKTLYKKIMARNRGLS